MTQRAGSPPARSHPGAGRDLVSESRYISATMRSTSILTALALAACAPARHPPTAEQMQGYVGTEGMPVDVQRFIVRWADCQHFLSEPPWDEARARQLARAVRQVCPGIDDEGRRIRARY
ncbi:MAG: hypothetical protein ACT4OE_02620, partial [Sphingosinicella sp.]